MNGPATLASVCCVAGASVRGGAVGDMQRWYAGRGELTDS